ncbi:hypothetical protein NHQ30_010527 [Ciborinia camelliae]|nr:hypothetical protein NHQ30_010527 [Ciborinia camelliae]
MGKERCRAKMDKERAAGAAAFKEISRPTTLSRAHTPDLHLMTVGGDYHGRQIAEDRNLNERHDNSLRSPSRAHQRTPSVDSKPEGNSGIITNATSSRPQERLVSVSNDSTPRSNDDTVPVALDVTDSEQGTIPGGESLDGE